MNLPFLKTEWEKYVRERNIRLFPNEDQSPIPAKDRDSSKEYIIRSIDELIEIPQVITPTHSYSSKNMTEFQKIIFLIEETNKILFGEDNFFATIVYDEYDIENGIQGINEIIANYVNWVDNCK